MRCALAATCVCCLVAVGWADSKIAFPDDDNCVPLSQCEPVRFMESLVQNRSADDSARLDNATRRMVDFIRDLRCGYEHGANNSLEVRVRCPTTGDDEDGDEADDAVKVSERVILDSRPEAAGKCSGSLGLHELHPELGLQVFRFRNRHPDLADLDGFDPELVFRVKTSGNCCWQLYSRPRFRGRPHIVPIGYDEENSDLFRSLQATECDLDSKNHW
jgi:hypothetical protein